MVPVPLFDALEMILAKKTSFSSTGFPIPGATKDNLILKALSLLRRDFTGLPHLEIHLHKSIPMGAGLGGGSADAGFALKLMNNLFDLHLEDWFLEDYAAQLGSDCPFFVENTPKIAKGRGEILEPIQVDLKGNHLILINPQIHISTQDAYAGVKPKLATVDIREVISDKTKWKEQLVNDFEASIFPKYPTIAKIKQDLYDLGAYYAAMSGSGATVFGLFEKKPTQQDWPTSFFVFEGGL